MQFDLCMNFVAIYGSESKGLILIRLAMKHQLLSRDTCVFQSHLASTILLKGIKMYVFVLFARERLIIASYLFMAKYVFLHSRSGTTGPFRCLLHNPELLMTLSNQDSYCHKTSTRQVCISKLSGMPGKCCFYFWY